MGHSLLLSYKQAGSIMIICSRKWKKCDESLRDVMGSEEYTCTFPNALNPRSGGASSNSMTTILVTGA